MKDARLDLRKLKIGPIPGRISAAIMKKRPAALRHFGHYVGVGGRGVGRGFEVLGVDLQFPAVGENLFAQRIFANQSGSKKGKGSAELGQIDKEIVRRATSALALAANIRQLLGLGIYSDKLDLVDDPVSPGEQPLAGRNIHLFHGTKLLASGRFEALTRVQSIEILGF